ncbi:Ornighine carbamoyltransferase [Mycena indigotica]|uniref:ornithine carbamoyltransferase n=1 Tax=Mycena indigotica TaxID=2126181 RepID=A0A8H6SN71_9AGAR|nr:Ornighine carbamoyltransferase [Mycena indigotica]KAF7301897.1 Ornighine carbamoyltransferase [Mycena indigotica]
MANPPHLLTLADLTVPQIQRLLNNAHVLKQTSTPWLYPTGGLHHKRAKTLRLPSQSLFNKSVALLFSKRSTRTRVAAETSASLLGGRALFLGKEDIQIGVNESARDSARVIGGMCQGIFARVGDHSEVEEFAKHSPVPVVNALSSLWHPTQILADLMTLHENSHLFGSPEPVQTEDGTGKGKPKGKNALPTLRPLTIAYVGDSANVLHDMLVTFPRFGHQMRIATPADAKYRAPDAVWDRVVELGCDKDIKWTADPKEAVKGADVVVTDTWISMGQEAEAEQRYKDFAGFQVTEELCRLGGANPDWKFMHCLPRKKNEVDDEVFYGPRSLVFPEADNRKWTIMSVFEYVHFSVIFSRSQDVFPSSIVIGKWDMDGNRWQNEVIDEKGQIVAQKRIPTTRPSKEDGHESDSDEETK